MDMIILKEFFQQIANNHKFCSNMNHFRPNCIYLCNYIHTHNPGNKVLKTTGKEEGKDKRTKNNK